MPRLPAAFAQGPGAEQSVALLARARQAATDGFFEEAARLLARLQIADPFNADALRELGTIAFRRGDIAEGARQFRLLLKMRPNDAEGWKTLAVALEQASAFPEALECHEKIVALRPNDREAYFQYGSMLYFVGRFAEAAAAFRSLLDENPAAAEPLGWALLWCRRFDEAGAAFDRALTQPDAPAHAFMNKAAFLLVRGDLPGGHALMERRREHLTPGQKPKSDRPQWLGETDLAGRTLYVHWEQGFGDTIQYARYVPLAARAGARVILEVRRPLLRLMSTLEGVSHLIVDGDPVPEHDFYCPVASLPLAFGTKLDTIPAEVPYLRADPAAVAEWRTRLGAVAGKRIGLVFAGSARTGLGANAAASDKRRSIPLAMLAPLATVRGCSFFSLQYGPPAAEVAHPPAGMMVHDHTKEFTNFGDAALIENLDLVISVDTATAHLTGAMGKPVWLLNPLATDWRWLLDREDSPWYPTMRIFRQPAPGDWATPIARVAEELRAFAAV